MSDQDDSVVREEEAEALVSWLEAFPAPTLQKRLGELIDRRRKLNGEIEFLQAQLVRYRQYVQDLAEPGSTARDRPVRGIRATATVGGATGPTGLAHPEFPPKRLAVQRLLAENAFKEWKLSELRDELIRRGWIADDGRARHALQVLMLNMARRGEVEKPATGIYRAKVEATAQTAGEADAAAASVLFHDSG